MKKFFTIISLMFIVGIKVFAVPAYPYPIVFQQPDGDKVTVLMKGDERIHWSESPDGYTLLYNKSGYLTYAVLDENGNLQPSEHIATDVEKRDAVVHSFLNTIGKKSFYSDAQKQLMLKVWEIEDEFEHRGDRSVTGQYKTLCAFVQFPEKPFIKQMSDFEDLMNQVGYTGNGTGSVRDFFKESSYGQFDLIITLCGVYTAPNSESYYAGSDGTQYGNELGKWAAQKVADEPSINFADYDSDNNGSVDGFHFIFAGRGQEAGGGAGTIWSHKWSFWPAVTKNGKSISIYSCSPELLYSDITTIGVICHEMTHAFGAPDFYDTNYDDYGDGQYDGTGQWDIMAGGSWNGIPGGNCPPHHNTYTKVQFGWMTPTVLSVPITIANMPNSAENAVAYRINTGNGDEHYLLANRQQVKFDAAIPGYGLLIYHVDGNVGTSCINCTHPQRLYPVCASSTTAIPAGAPSDYGSINSAGCPFPGSSNNTSFDGTSTPRMFYWNNTVIPDKPITEIQNTSNQTVSFKFMGGATISSNANLASLTVVPGTLNPVFSPNITNYTVNVAYAVTAITITGVAEDANATVSGNVTNASLNVGNNNFTITVTAQDGTTIKNYNVTVIRAASSNANLASLTVNQGTLTPAFSPNITSYTVNVAYAVTAITITGVAEDANAIVSGNVTNAPLNVGNNSFTITVTAQDGTATQNYNVTVIRAALSSNANLASLTVNQGTLAPAFSPNITSYTVNVAYSVTAITITGAAEDPIATVTGNVTNAPLNVGNNSFTIKVTAQDGTTIQNYIVTVIRAAASSNANLASLTVNPGTLNPAFSPNTTNYTVDVAYTVTTITITGIAADANATISGTGPKPLNIGSNNFTITVTAQDGATKDYYINVIRAAASSNANLATLIVNQGTLSPVFDPNTTAYTVDVANTVTTITITGAAEDPIATVTGNVTNAPLNVGSNNFTIKVTAQNGTIKNYIVTVIRAGSSNANLASLTVDPYILSPAFNPNITDYIVDVAKIVTTITITATVQEPNATVTGTVTNAPLIIGSNLFTITVTAQDGTTKDYHINVIRAGNDNANLTNLVYSTGTLVPMFNPNITNYTLNVANMVTDITLVGIPEDPNATVAGNVYNYPINVGSNPFTITVTAEDGITTKDYYINVVRAFSGNGADLASLTVDPGVLVPAFSPNITVYTVNVANSVTVMNYITGVPEDPSATVTGNVVNAPLNVGSNLFTITVTASNGVTTKNYYVTVVRAGDGSNANLINLIVSSGTLTPTFNPNITVYTLNVAYMSTTITLIGVPEDPSATVTGNVNSVPINVGSNPFTITVTAANGITTKSYYVDVVRTDVNSNANLASLTVTPGTLMPDFSPDITNYTVNVAHTVATITIKGTAQSPYATVSGNVTNAPINFGSNNFTITVTAEDETTIKKYNVIVIRATTPQHTIIASVEGDTGGTISPKGAIPVGEGEDITFTMSPDYGCYIYYVFVDGVNVGTEKTYTFKNVTSNHNIVVKFDRYLDIEDVETDNYPSVRIYPNPTTGLLTICDMRCAICDIEIFDILGRTVGATLAVAPDGTHQLQIGASVPPGIYFIRITTENDVVTKKIIKSDP